MGSGPVLLLVHGTGAATHSWRDLAPLLARQFTVIAPDLPGHGFTSLPPPEGLSLPGMARELDALLAALDVRPDIVVGHSAGAAILARMCLDGPIAPRRLVSLNGALLPLRGLPGQVFSPIAKLAAATSVMPRLFAWHARVDRRVIERLVRETGSTLDPVGTELYRRLAHSPGHVGAAFGMMANWDLRPLARELPRLQTPLVLVAGGRDKAIPAADAERVHGLLPSSRLMLLPELGHLAHEERPAEVARIVLDLAADPAQGVPG
jgi:magnesium chelatase accessory protein